MNSDIRISIGFLDHPKTIKLKKELGWEGIESLMRLWFFVAQYKPDGVLSHMDAEEVEIASKWNGRPGLFVSTAQKLRLLDHDDGTFSLHDWDEHNSYCIHAMDRKEQARKAAEKRWKMRFKNAPSNADSNAPSNAPSPAPVPSPVPSPKKLKKDIAPTVSEKRNGSKPSPPIFLDDDFNWQNITEAHLTTWSQAYPACDIQTELMRSALYIRAHPNKRKRNWERYIIGWFGRAQEWGGTKGTAKSSWDIDAWAAEKDGVQ